MHRPAPFRPFDVPRCSADWSETPGCVRLWPVMLAVLAAVVLLALAEYVAGAAE